MEGRRSLLLSLAASDCTVLKLSEDRRLAAERLERLVRASFYGALSTQDARVGITLQISLDAVKLVEPTYANRLASALDDTSSCRAETKEFGVHQNFYYQCGQYTVINDWHDGKFVRFAHGSSLLPDPNTEPFVAALLSRAAVGLKVGDFSESSFWGDPGFALRSFPDNASYLFDGRSLEIKVANAKVPGNYLPDRNLTSMVDLAGKQVNVYVGSILELCPERTSPRCDALAKAFDAFELWRFALVFPHRHDLIFDRVGRLMPFEERLSKTGHRYYSYVFPANVEEFVMADRIDPFRR